MNLNTGFDCIAAAATALLLYSGVAAPAPSARVAKTEPRVIEVVAKRFTFEPPVIEIAQGEPVRLLVRSADGLHGFGIKKLRVAEEIPRGGQPVTIEFTAPTAGEFEIVCSEYCGKGHDDMRGRLVVRAREGER